jgi:aryl-alcohol dehydrogenase-like predicted oxidoreductase
MQERATTTSAADIVDRARRSGGPLGFGCGELYGGVRRRESLRLIEAALDAGFAYFDTARLYGHGEAEGLLGGFMRSHRDRIVLASKVGILPTHNPLSRRILTKAALAARTIGPLRALVPTPAVAEPRFHVFAPGEMAQSVEVSLRALKTDHLDFLLLHECSLEEARAPETLAFVERLQTQGKIREWGIAAGIDTTIALAGDAHAPPLLQFAHNAWDRTVARVRERSNAPFITHSVLGANFRALAQRLKQDEALRELAKSKDLDPDDGPGLAQRLLAAAVRDNPGGLVLFSASKPAQVAHGKAAADFAADEAEAALALVAAAQRMTC